MREEATGRKDEDAPDDAPTEGTGATVATGDPEVAMGSAQDELGDLVARARLNGQRTVLVRYGKPVAAIVPFADYQRLRAIA